MERRSHGTHAAMRFTNPDILRPYITATPNRPAALKPNRQTRRAATATTPSHRSAQNVAPSHEVPRSSQSDIVRVFPGTGGTLRVMTFRGVRVVEAQNLGRDVLGYSDGRKLTYKISSDPEYVEGTHYFMLEGADLSEFKEVRELCTDSVQSSEVAFKHAPRVLLVTQKGVRLAAMKAQTSVGVAAREWLTEVWREIDETGGYRRHDAPLQLADADLARIAAVVSSAVLQTLAVTDDARRSEIATLRTEVAELRQSLASGEIARTVPSLGARNARRFVLDPLKEMARKASGPQGIGGSAAHHRTRLENAVRAAQGVQWSRPRRFENFPWDKLGELREAVIAAQKNVDAICSARGDAKQTKLPFDSN